MVSISGEKGMCLTIGSSQSGRVSTGMKAVESISNGISIVWIRLATCTGCADRSAMPQNSSASTSPMAKATPRAAAAPTQESGSAPQTRPRTATVITDTKERSRSVAKRPPMATAALMGMARIRASSPDSTSTASASAEPPAVNRTAWNIQAAIRNSA